MKWVKVKNKKEWACDVCRTCGDPACCDTPAKWIKHPAVRVPKGRLLGEDYMSDLALCEKCLDSHHERLLREFMEYKK